ncbi:MAG: EscU/YscU/HrcU family type III secretion system export apparatus switch protein [Campylobacteraceae bacterium]|nr:EscU/YscU/HrcU family type III secretion system export apparatus switch protein [Campylobacteraceae bacterium]
MAKLNKEYIQKAAALQYDHLTENAPKVVAKGQGDVAKNIIKIAKDNNLPIKKDEDLIELLSKLDIDKEIPTEMYKAVAEIFSFIYGITNKKEEN